MVTEEATRMLRKQAAQSVLFGSIGLALGMFAVKYVTAAPLVEAFSFTLLVLVCFIPATFFACYVHTIRAQFEAYTLETTRILNPRLIIHSGVSGLLLAMAVILFINAFTGIHVVPVDDATKYILAGAGTIIAAVNHTIYRRMASRSKPCERSNELTGNVSFDMSIFGRAVATITPAWSALVVVGLTVYYLVK